MFVFETVVHLADEIAKNACHNVVFFDGAAKDLINVA